MIDLLTFSNETGHLSVLERVIHGDLQTALFRTGTAMQEKLNVAYQSPGDELLLCVKGNCRVAVHDQAGKTADYRLDGPAHALMLLPGERCRLSEVTADCLLLFLSAHFYSPSPVPDARSHRPSTTESSV